MPAEGAELPSGPVDVWTDGACSGNPGPGGWGVLMRGPAGERELSGGEALTTNNRMELLAAITALETLEPGAKVRLHTDSEYVMKGITAWLASWKRRGWKTADGKPVKNKDLWQRLEAAAERHEIAWAWLRGHAGHAENERADVLARAAIVALRRG